jgi:hypothetical protein
MRFQLVPGPLAQQTIEYDDVDHKLLVNLDLVPLSDTQYRLVIALLRQRKRWKEDSSEQEQFVLSIQQLQQISRLRDPNLVRFHLFRAAARVAERNLGWVIASVHGWGYGIFRLGELPPPPGTSSALTILGEETPSRLS